MGVAHRLLTTLRSSLFTIYDSRFTIHDSRFSLADYKSESLTMSKRILRLVSLLALASLVTAVLVLNSSFGVRAQRARAIKKEVANTAARNTAIIETTSAVLKETSEIRELPVRRPVKSGAESRADIERMLIRNLDKQTTPADMRATELALRKFGLVGSTFQYRPFIIKLLTEQVAGYYDTRAQQFYLADWLDLEGQKPVMSHELAHALQDQHFNLRRFEKWPKGDSDAELAAHALIEGDATLAMTFYMVRNPLVALAFRRSLGAGGISTEQYDQAPRAIRESLIFPYLNGAEWATQLYKRGGWKTITAAYARLPLSTEQILHPDKYFSYKRPVKMVLPDVAGLLNASSQQTAISSQPKRRGAGRPPASSARAGRQARKRSPASPRPHQVFAWRRIDSDVNGEWSYYLLLDQFLNSATESKRAAAGWGGDRYDVYEGPGGQVFLAQLTAWDTENDAREFYDAYIKRTRQRYADEKELDTDSQSEGQSLSAWETGEGAVVIQLRGSRVAILEGIPAGINHHALLKAIAH